MSDLRYRYCRNCPAPSMQLHHIVYQQEVRRHKGDLGDHRNFLPLCKRCHERHHWGGENRIELQRLDTDAFEFAAELLGPEAAYEYLRRHYRGTDPRLDALLHPQEKAA